MIGEHDEIPVPAPLIDADGAGWCHDECPAAKHLGRNYWRCLAIDREAALGTPYALWVVKAAAALQAAEILEKRRWNVTIHSTVGSAKRWWVSDLMFGFVGGLGNGWVETVLAAEAAWQKREAEEQAKEVSDGQ
jgi:hypothetical protein